ncbi:MAG: hypothetical protein GX675_04940 [Erysipelotrichaceae bacterium]|nr:hypothetical protein [Erysipelotrichaceae bacterium]
MTEVKEILNQEKQDQPKKRYIPTNPKKYRTVEAFEIAVNSYFDECYVTDKIPNVLGLALHLKISRDTLCQYQKKNGYSKVVIKAKEIIEEHKIQKLYTSKNATGVIFDLKCNHGWQDKQVIEQTLTVKSIEDFLTDEEMEM